MFSPKTVLLCSLMWTFWSLAACTSGNAASSITDFVPWNDPKYPLIDWVRSKHGGYVSDKIEIRSRPLSPKDDNSPIDFGWFATDDVAEGEVLMIIPPDAYIDTDAKYNQKTYDDDDADDDPLCTDIVKLVQEYKKGEESDYYVLASFILDEDSPGSMRNRQPGFWSQEARHILWRTMLDEFLHPDEGESNLSFADDCGFSVDLTRADSRERQLYESAFRYFISKANGNILFSLHDLIHHRNGKWRNVDLKRERNGRIVLKAFQEIPKDGQLYKSFNRCDFADGNCDNWDENFVATQDVLRGTGMLEDYPRRWIIVAQPGSEEYTSVFDIDKTKDGRFHVTWKTGTPNIFVLNFMEAYRKSFDAKEAKIKEQVANLESNFERDTILRFLTAYKEALYLGWIHRNGDQSTTDVELDPFEEPKGLGIQVDDYFMCYIDRDCAGRDFDNTYMNSHYQSMKWKHCPEEDNSCLTLDSIIQSCTSFRPHYHESFVHIPAQYAKEMKRVAFLGGGDNLRKYIVTQSRQYHILI
jgi:SET domain